MNLDDGFEDLQLDADAVHKAFTRMQKSLDNIEDSTTGLANNAMANAMIEQSGLAEMCKMAKAASELALAMHESPAMKGMSKEDRVRAAFSAASLMAIRFNESFTEQQMEKLRDAFAHVSCGDTCVGASQIAFSLFVNHDGTDDSFDADTDSDRPQIGENLAKNNRKYCIGAVKHVTAKQMIEAKNSGTLNELVKMDGYEQSACRQHATRQGIFWICGLKLAEES